MKSGGKVNARIFTLRFFNKLDLLNSPNPNGKFFIFQDEDGQEYVVTITSCNRDNDNGKVKIVIEEGLFKSCLKMTSTDITVKK